MQFRIWVYYTVFIILMIGILVGTIQKYRQSDKVFKRIFIIISIIMAIFVLIYWPFMLLGIAIIYTEEYVVEMESQKYVIHVYSWANTEIKYYEYINFLVMKDKEKMIEVYEGVGYETIRDKFDKYKPDLVYYTNQ